MAIKEALPQLQTGQKMPLNRSEIKEIVAGMKIGDSLLCSSFKQCEAARQNGTRLGFKMVSRRVKETDFSRPVTRKSVRDGKYRIWRKE